MFTPQRSQSGSGLSINTGAANSAGIRNPQPASGGFTGSKPIGSFFGSAASTAPSAGTLFGTPAANTTGTSSLFGSTTNAPSQAGTLFGGPAAAAQPSQSTSLFGITAAPKPSFLGNTPTPQPQPQTGSLFGNTPSQPQPQPQQQTTSLFGNPTAPTQQQTTSLFGNPSAQQPQASSLFGNAPQAQPAPSSLFGNSSAQQQQPSSLFGDMGKTAGTGANLYQAKSQQLQQAASGILFGGVAPQPQQNAGLFGNQQAGNFLGGSNSGGSFGSYQNTQGGLQRSTLNPAQRTQKSLFSTTIGAYTAEQQAVPGVRINLSELRPTTRFNDLHEGVQKEIEVIDTFIYNQIRLAGECESLMPHNATKVSTMPPDVEICARKLEALERSLEADAVSIEDAKKLARKDAHAARLSFKAISSLRMPAHLQSGINFRTETAGLTSTVDDASSSTDLLSYFDNQTEEMNKKLDVMKNQLSEVESYLYSIEAQQIAQTQSIRLSHGRDGGVKSAEDQIKEMANALQSFEGGILSVASRITATRESLGGLIVGDSMGRIRR